VDFIEGIATFFCVSTCRLEGWWVGIENGHVFERVSDDVSLDSKLVW
jgi:hypothetical protein